MRAIVQDAIDFGIPGAIGACATDSRFYRVLNEGIQRLLFKGKWWGTVQRYRFCVTDGEITLPKQIAAIEAAMVSGFPVAVRDMWYEFLENGFGLRQAALNPAGGNCRVWGTNECIYRGRYPTFSNIVGTDKLLTVMCDRSSDVGKQVLFLGYDQNNNWIRTMQNGAVADGEVVTLAQTPGVQSVNYFTAVTDIQPPNNLDGQWWLYEYSALCEPAAVFQSLCTPASPPPPVVKANRLIGHYQYDDVRPSFARYLLPGILSQGTPGCCCLTAVDVAAKLDFTPVKKTNDYLIIGNLPALKEICMGINNAENDPNGQNKTTIINTAMQSATLLLDQELDHYLGSGRKQGMNVQYYGDDEPVMNFI